MFKWIALFITASCAMGVGIKASQRYDEATEFARTHTPFQCGHAVFLRATQLAGIPIEMTSLNKLPAKKNGITLGELEKAFIDVGFNANIGFTKEPLHLPKLSVCKLDEPDHFVLVEYDGNSKYKIFSDLDRYRLVSEKFFAARFSGYFLELSPQKNAINRIAASDDPAPQFQTLWQDAGELNLLQATDPS